MSSDIAYKKYQNKDEYSYTLGAFPTIELLKNKPQYVREVFVHSDMDSAEQREILASLCKDNNISLSVNKKIVEKLRDKENIFCIGIFNKYNEELSNGNHVVLVNPGDMGNLGTIIRTCIGFGFNDLVIIEPAADIFNPKVVRASMGALFQLRFKRYSSFDEYVSGNKQRNIYLFMLKGAENLQTLKRDNSECFSLVFGNEATGLPDEFVKYGKSVLIKHKNTIDSLNLSMACGIALYEFSK